MSKPRKTKGRKRHSFIVAMTPDQLRQIKSEFAMYGKRGDGILCEPSMIAGHPHFCTVFFPRRQMTVLNQAYKELK